MFSGHHTAHGLHSTCIIRYYTILDGALNLKLLGHLAGAECKDQTTSSSVHNFRAEFLFFKSLQSKGEARSPHAFVCLPLPMQWGELCRGVISMIEFKTESLFRCLGLLTICNDGSDSDCGMADIKVSNLFAP
eukprot:scaffold123735_cov47-Prasinocladus_malaysianus.AAC.1